MTPIGAAFSEWISKIVGSGKRFAAGLMLSMILLSGCAAGPEGVDVCGPWRPIYISSLDQLTGITGRQILAHNEVGARLCGWVAVRD